MPQLISQNNPTPPSAFDPWNTGTDIASGITGIVGPTNAVFPYIFDAPLPPPPGFPPIWVSFSDAVNPAVVTTTDPSILSVWRAQLLEYNGRQPVAGAWTVAGTSDVPTIDNPASALVFTPSGTALPNSRYIIHVGRGLPFTSGYYLEESYEWHFLSRLTPFYVDPYALRERLGEIATKVSEEILYYEIWQASITANRETLIYVPYLQMGGPTAQQVISWRPPHTLALAKFTEVEAALQITRKLLHRYLELVDRKNQGLDFATEVEDGLIKNLQLAVKMLQAERDPLYSEISLKKAQIHSARKGSAFPGAGLGLRGRGLSDGSFRQRRRF